MSLANKDVLGYSDLGDAATPTPQGLSTTDTDPLFHDRRPSSRTIEGFTAALRFLFVKTMRRPYLPDEISFPKQHKRLAIVLSQEEVSG